VAGALDDELLFQVRQNPLRSARLATARQSNTTGPSPCSSRKRSIQLAEMVREDGIAFPPCFDDLLMGTTVRDDRVV
jgi:hypothetical protein